VFLNLVSKAEQGYFLADESLATARAIESDDESGGEATASLNRLLQRLSQSWLKQQSVSMKRLNLDALVQLVARGNMVQPWSELAEQLQNGTKVSDLLQQPLLGQVQLAMLRQVADERGA